MKSTFSRSAYSLLSRRARRERKDRSRCANKLRLEQLEDRRLLASDFMVNTNLDLEDTVNDGIVDVDPNTPGNQLSLREAIKLANADANSRITFELPGNRTIVVDSELPALTNPMFIDAAEQVGANPVTLNTSIAGGSVNGLVVQSDGVVVHGLRIEGFGGAGVFGDTTADATLVLNEVIVRDNLGFGVLHRGSLHVNRATNVAGTNVASVFSGNGKDGLSALRDIMADRLVIAEGKQGAGIFAQFDVLAHNGITSSGNAGPGIQSLFGAIELNDANSISASPTVIVTDNGGPGILAGRDIVAVADAAPGVVGQMVKT